MSIRKVFNTPVPSQLCKNVVLFRDGRVMRKHTNIDLPEVEESLKPVNVTRKGRYTIAGESYSASLDFALNFVPRPGEKYNELLHIDGDVGNYMPENLMWVTRGEKMGWHSYLNGGSKNAPIFLECLNFQRKFTSMKEVCETYGVTDGKVRAHLAGYSDYIDAYDEQGFKIELRLRKYEGIERILFWVSDPTTWVVHPKYNNYLVAPEGLVVKLDSDSGLGSPLTNYYNEDNELWVKTGRKELLSKLLKSIFGEQES